MEVMVTNPDFWRAQRVFLTGHTGFKGSWASLLLTSLGAKVYGYALAPKNPEDLFVVANVQRDVSHELADILDFLSLRRAIEKARPTIVLHMAAQALVRQSYSTPVETYAINVMGTAHLLEAVRQVDSVKATVIVTSDKCYENMEWEWGYREIDRLGGHDPYSSSKACAELIADSYRKSFFGNQGLSRIASARAGNVIGGGDWARDRLIPDAIRAFSSGQVLRVRYPGAIRPWQHVLDPLLGYLRLAEQLAGGSGEFQGAWNFGPHASNELSVATVLGTLVSKWGQGARWEVEDAPQPHEASYLKLDCSKAHLNLGWQPQLDLSTAMSLVVDWYRAYQTGNDMRQFSLMQINQVLGR